MLKMNPVYLTQDNVRNLLPKEIGHGTDGIVFKYNKDYLIKLYHSKLKF